MQLEAIRRKKFWNHYVKNWLSEELSGWAAFRIIFPSLHFLLSLQRRPQNKAVSAATRNIPLLLPAALVRACEKCSREDKQVITRPSRCRLQSGCGTHLWRPSIHSQTPPNASAPAKTIYRRGDSRAESCHMFCCSHISGRTEGKFLFLAEKRALPVPGWKCLLAPLPVPAGSELSWQTCSKFRQAQFSLVRTFLNLKPWSTDCQTHGSNS